jgi:hypothetical protein
MGVTRKVLTEKELLFSKYSDPSDVPDYVWESIYSKLIHKDEGYFILLYIIDNIFVPLLKTNEYSINVANTLAYVRFTTEVCYENFVIDIMMIRGFILYPRIYDFRVFKNRVCENWRNKTKTFLSARHYLDNKHKFEPIHTLDYKECHVRFYSVGSAIDVRIFKEKTEVLALCDFKTLQEAESSSKRHINEGEWLD